MEPTRSPVWTFVRLVLSNWSSRVTGPLSAILIITGVGLNVVPSFQIAIPNFVTSLTWVLAIICGVQAVYSIWYKEYAAHCELLVRTRPKLKCDFNKTLPGCIQNARITRRSSSATTITNSQISLGWSQDLVSVQPTGPSFFVYENPVFVAATYYRIKVDTDGPNSVSGCCGYLTDIERWNDNRLTSVLYGNSLRLAFAPSEHPDTISKKIDPGVSQYLDFLVITEQDQAFIPTYKWEIPSSLNIDEIFSYFGYYIFHIMIVPEAGNPASIAVKVLWTGNHNTVNISQCK